MKKNKKKKIEWSKFFCSLIAISFGVFSIWCGYEYYRLSLIAIEMGTMLPDSSLAVTCVTVVIASLLSYLLYQMGLKNSRNKYGIDENGQPFKEKFIVYNDPEQEEKEEEVG